MSIIVINSSDPNANEVIATSIRNSQISQGKGALIVRAGADHERRHQLEKIIVAKALPSDGTPVPAENIPWKPDSTVVVMSSDLFVLEEFEELVPGFKEALGPITTFGA